jgi:hypothetical protein
MSTFAEDIEEVAGEEPILSVVIAPFNSSYDDEECPRDDRVPLKKAIPWADARAHLNYDYDVGFGGADYHPIYAWTATRVLFVHEYDGSTGIVWVPRNPMDCTPKMNGE